MTNNPTFRSKTKHIDIFCHFIRDLVAKREIIVKYYSTQEKLANMLTKILPKEKFSYLRSQLGV